MCGQNPLRVVSHANNSFFWVVTQFSNMSTRDGYRLQTLGTLVQGTVGALAVWAASSALLCKPATKAPFPPVC
jgi:GntP family gluconate:H+ symporter